MKTNRYDRVYGVNGSVMFQLPRDPHRPFAKFLEIAVEQSGNQVKGYKCSGKTLSKANLTGLNFYDCHFRDSTFHMADLRSSNFIDCDFSGADFSGARIKNINLTGSDLTGLQTAGSGLIMVSNVGESWLCVDTVNRHIYSPSKSLPADKYTAADFPNTYKIIRAILEAEQVGFVMYLDYLTQKKQ